ncbi:matrixin family metalloprotease [Luteimicrobium album]|uniref:matrixin family metalloprotease n=1 Tax=Luteimicrobium album TaxID=1054550 RepID=UPI0024E189E0|nr:M57 family metalloprotease [Luteimicrobium album]
MIVLLILSTLGLTTITSPAMAYTKTGCKWHSAELKIRTSSVASTYSTGISYAILDYNNRTQAPHITRTTASGPSWTAASGNYGATGWEAHAQWSCPLGIQANCAMKLNTHYLSGTETDVNDRIVWSHEMGHCMGLDHVSGLHHVMYTSATKAYNDGVVQLTSDEVNGINAIY